MYVWQKYNRCGYCPCSKGENVFVNIFLDLTRYLRYLICFCIFITNFISDWWGVYYICTVICPILKWKCLILLYSVVEFIAADSSMKAYIVPFIGLVLPCCTGCHADECVRYIAEPDSIYPLQCYCCENWPSVNKWSFHLNLSVQWLILLHANLNLTRDWRIWVRLWMLSSPGCELAIY